MRIVALLVYEHFAPEAEKASSSTTTSLPSSAPSTSSTVSTSPLSSSISAFKLINEAYHPKFHTVAFWQSDLKKELRTMGQALLETVPSPQEMVATGLVNIIHSEILHDYTVNLLYARDIGLTIILQNPEETSVPIHSLCDQCFSIGSEIRRPQILQELLTKLNVDFEHLATHRQKITNLQEQLDETARILRQNVYKVIDRQEKLEEILAKTQHLEHLAEKFRQSSRKLNRNCCPLL